MLEIIVAFSTVCTEAYIHARPSHQFFILVHIINRYSAICEPYHAAAMNFLAFSKKLIALSIEQKRNSNALVASSAIGDTCKHPIAGTATKLEELSRKYNSDREAFVRGLREKYGSLRERKTERPV